MVQSGGGLEATNFSSFAFIIKHDLENEAEETLCLR
jgi:hypothetical protein